MWASIEKVRNKPYNGNLTQDSLMSARAFLAYEVANRQIESIGKLAEIKRAVVMQKHSI